MTDPATVDPDAIFRDRIVPVLFPPVDREDDPTLVLVAGSMGAGTARLTAQLASGASPTWASISARELRSFHPDFLALSRPPGDETRPGIDEAVASWVESALSHALTQARSVVFEGAFRQPSTVFALAEAFAGEGYGTRLVLVASRPAESLLSSVSLFLRQRAARLPAQLTSLAAHAASDGEVRALSQASDSSTSVDRVSVVDRGGKIVFDVDGSGGDSFDGAAAAFESVVGGRWSTLAAAAWFGELRRMTEFARDARVLTPAIAEVLLELHEMALRDVLPGMGLRSGSLVAVEQQRRIAAEIVELRRAVTVERPPDRSPELGPIPVPTPQLGGPSR